MVPGLPAKKKTAEELNLKSFEVEEVSRDAMEIKIPANRWADAASHWGIAKEAAAVFNKKLAFRAPKIVNLPRNRGFLNVKVEDPRLCPRYLALYFALPQKIGKSPVWMQKTLKACGLRPINAVVDIMNYVMLEIGQPLHAFDASKIDKGIVVRRAKKGEVIKTIDDLRFVLTKQDLLIADHKKPLALAGIKGGAGSEVLSGTKAIIVEAANFDSVNIYRTSRRLNLSTDASARFSHGQSPELVEWGANRAAVLLRDICAARLKDSVDLYPKKQARKLLRFDLERFNRLTGFKLDGKTAWGLLKKLGFSLIKEGLIETPALRLDIEIFEDLAEEAVRLYGFDKIKSAPPIVALIPGESEEMVILKEKIRRALISIGFSETYNSSFAAESDSDAVALENPISRDKAFLRTSLIPGLEKNIKDNLRFFENIKIFEIGKTFSGERENWRLGMATRLESENSFRELKGAAEKLLKMLGLTDYLFVPEDKDLRIESSHQVLGYLAASRRGSALEIDLDKLLKLVEAEVEYLPLSPYPAIERDISMYVDVNLRFNEILEAVNSLKIPHLFDADLIDYYKDENLKQGKVSLTFRLVFQSASRTLKDEEVNREVDRIIKVLSGKFGVKPR